MGVGGVGGPTRVYSDAELDVLLHISNLCNYVTQKQSLQSLRSMRSSSAFSSLFTQPPLLLDTMRMLAVYLFRLPARRFLLFDLFGGVAFTEANMQVFDGGMGEEAEVGRGESAGGEGRKAQSWLASPPVASRALPASPAPPRRPRPTLSTNALPPHPQTKAAPLSSGGGATPVPPAGGSGRGQSPVAESAAGGKGKAGASVGRDRSLSVPARGETGSYGGDVGSRGRVAGDESGGDLSAGGSSVSESSPSSRTSSPSSIAQGAGGGGGGGGIGRRAVDESLSSSPAMKP